MGTLLRCVVAIGALVPACRDAASIEHAPANLTHEAYVWQRAWTGAVREAVAAAPPELTGLRVLALEIEGGRQVWPDVVTDVLVKAGRPVTAVVRIDGSRPIADLSLEPLLGRLDEWRRAGVAVAGVEIDHDCATAALPEYAAWLRRARVPAPLRWSITALPTWAESPELARVAGAVDELVVQVHAVRAPTLFDPRQARRWVDDFAEATAGRPFRVAVPTYRVVIDGVPLAADPVEVAGFVRALERVPVPGLRGVVWFRLPIDADLTTWRTPTLRAAIGRRPLAPDVRVSLVERGRDVFDVVLANAGTLDARYPALRISGDLTAADLVAGYRRAPEPARWTPPDRTLAAGTRVVIGWTTGKDLTVDAN